MAEPSPIRAAWGAAHRAVALTWIVGTAALLGGIATLDESRSPEDHSRSSADRFRDAATISLVSAAIAHAALLPGTWIGRRESPSREHASPPRERASPPRERASADQEFVSPSPARQSVAGHSVETHDRRRDIPVAEKSHSDRGDGIVAWFAGTLIRLFGTVALVGCYRYQLSSNGDPSFHLAAIVGWYLVLTFVEVWVLAKALPAQDRP